ncbi:hypothetical protein Hanom_Chr14g01262701 [Helianthus anomalus]
MIERKRKLVFFPLFVSFAGVELRLQLDIHTFTSYLFFFLYFFFLLFLWIYKSSHIITF